MSSLVVYRQYRNGKGFGIGAMGPVRDEQTRV